MENKIKVIFELSKLHELKEDNEVDWFDFVAKFINDANKRCDFYFLINCKSIEKEHGFDVENFKTYRSIFLKRLKSKKVVFNKDDLNFGFYSDHTKFEDKNSVWFFELDDLANFAELTNEDSVFFFSYYDVGEALYYSNFFTVLLDFANYNDDNRKRKKIIKLVNNVVDNETQDEINYEKISYEFLTFIEAKN